jgi:hypothetical protein
VALTTRWLSNRRCPVSVSSHCCAFSGAGSPAEDSNGLLPSLRPPEAVRGRRKAPAVHPRPLRGAACRSPLPVRGMDARWLRRPGVHGPAPASRSQHRRSATTSREWRWPTCGRTMSNGLIPWRVLVGGGIRRPGWPAPAQRSCPSPGGARNGSPAAPCSARIRVRSGALGRGEHGGASLGGVPRPCGCSCSVPRCALGRTLRPRPKG